MTSCTRLEREYTFDENENGDENVAKKHQAVNKACLIGN